jgi:hypothetical protein
MEHDLYKSLGDVDMCRKFDMFEIQVLIIFFGTPVFSARRDGRYSSKDFLICISLDVLAMKGGVPTRSRSRRPARLHALFVIKIAVKYCSSLLTYVSMVFTIWRLWNRHFIGPQATSRFLSVPSQ